MSTGLLIALVLVAALACPLHMWWQSRRGRQAACCPPGRRTDEPAELDADALRQRHAQLSRQIAELDSTPAADPSPTAGTR